MKSTMKRLLLPALVVCVAMIGAMIWTTRLVVAQQQHKPIIVTRLYSGSDGQTHVEKIEVKLNLGNDGTARSGTEKATGVRFSRLPAGLFQDFHNGPRLGQYVITISGRAELEIADGQKVIQEPGVILLAEDATGKGHTARVGPNEDLVTIGVPLAAK